MLKHLGCSIFLLCSFFAAAQKLKLSSSPVDSTFYTYATRTQQLLGLSSNSKATDTTLDNINNYYQTGVLGNMGLPSYSLLAQAPQHGTASFFSWNKLNNRNDLITEDDPLYFNTARVYTKVTALMGQKQEQFLKLVHVQKIKKVNVSLLFNRYSCTGFYLQQQSLVTNLLLSSNYKTTNGRWGYHFYFLYNKLKYQTNDGVHAADSLSYYALQNKNMYPFVPFFASSNPTQGARQNLRTASISFNTFYRLNKNDSGATNHYLVYEGNYQTNYLLYIDETQDSLMPGNGHYQPQSDRSSHDSTGCRLLTNSMLYKLSLAQGKLVLYGGYKLEAIKYHQHYIDTIGKNQVLKGGLALNTEKHLLYASADYNFWGLNKSNYVIDARYSYFLNKNFTIEATGNIQSRTPNFNLLAYEGNRFWWKNNFSPAQVQDVGLTLSSNKYKFYVGVFSMMQQHQIYLDTNALPTQYAGNTNITRFFVNKNISLFRNHLHFNNTANYQLISNEKIIRLPHLYTLHQLYYEGKLFKKNLWLQIGAQARYISSFMASAYAPATNQFYLQNNTYCGNYLFVDVFVNFAIGPVKFFVLAQHINQGFMATNYILAPNYPMPDRAFKVGLIWNLFN
ncbi:MAG: hypothetical protein JST67_10450 [Bacteroidetes bacterium]|nr:hypothetical protein [Bacteroidota bacterium]